MKEAGKGRRVGTVSVSVFHLWGNDWVRSQFQGEGNGDARVRAKVTASEGQVRAK